MKKWSNVTPPEGFSYIENCICICNEPFTQGGLDFISSIGVGGIVSTLNNVDEFLESFANDSGIEIYNQSFPGINEINSWIKSSLELILSIAFSSTVLIVGKRESVYSGLLVGCLRRLQRWSLFPIISEFRSYYPRKQYPEAEQYIEYFEVSNIELPLELPAFLDTSKMDKYEEELRNKAKNADEQLVYDLLFPPSSALVSPNVQFDGNLSLLIEKDDDD